MSDYIAEAKVLIVPDTTQFRSQLQSQLGTATSAASNQVTNSTKNLTRSVTGATTALRPFNKATANSTAKLLGAGSATARLDAALLGLRSAVGSSAVIGLGALALGAIAAGKGFRAMVGLTASFETQLNTFQAVTGATADEMGRVSAAAAKLGADVTLPAVSAADAAEAMTQLAKAGLSVQDAIDGARGVLQLATAAAISNEEAVRLAASAINSFGLAGRDAVRVADVLANAANNAQGSIADMGLALQQAATVGRQVGLSFEDTSTFLTILAKNGLRGSDAGTSFRTAMIRLINPTDEASAKIKELGVQLRDAQGNLRVDVFQQFSNALRKATPEVRDQTYALLGGSDAVRAFTILGRQSVKQLLEMRAAMRDEGTAADVAAARTKGLAGSAGALGSTLETVGIQLGQKLSPSLQSVTNGLTQFVGALSSVGKEAKILGVNINPVSNALGGTLLKGLLATIVALKSYSLVTKSAIVNTARLQIALASLEWRSAAAGATAMTGALASLTRGMAGFRAVSAAIVGSFNFWFLGITAVSAGLIYLITRETAAEKATKNLKKATDELTASLGNLETARQSATSAGLGVGAAELSIEQAKLAEAQARATLQNSTAAKGSRERRQLELQLAVAIQNVTFAQQDYGRAVKQSVEANDAVRAAQERAKRARVAEIDSLSKLVDAKQKEARIEAGLTPSGEGGSRKQAIDAEINSRLNLVKTLREQAAEEMVSDDASARAIGRRKQLIADLIATQKRLPTRTELQFIVNTPNIQKIVKDLVQDWQDAGFSSADAYRRYLLAGLGIAADEVSDFLRGPFADAATRASKEAMAAAAEAGAEEFSGKITLGLSLKIQLAEAKGASDQELLTLARQRLLSAQRTLAKAEANFAKYGTQRQKEFVDRASDAVIAAQADVDSITGRIESAAKDQADKITTAREKADQLIVDAINGIRRQAQSRRAKLIAQAEISATNRLEAAQNTETLRDDIAAYNILVRITAQEIKFIKKEIKDTDLKRQLVEQLTDELRGYKAARAKAAQERKEQIQQERVERADLNIELAQITENVSAEIKAHRAKIRALKAQQDRTKKGTIEYLRLRNEIAREQAAIEELRKQQKDRNDAFRKMSFEFLTRQQGFAATVMSNMLGNVVLRGSVGGTTSPTTGGRTSPSASTALTGAEGFGGGLAEALIRDRQRRAGGGGAPSSQLSMRTAENEAGARGGTPSQFMTIIHLLQQMVRLLGGAEGRSKHPENKKSASVGGSAMDTM